VSPRSEVDLPNPIVDVTIENPYNLQDFKDDKLSILDIKAIDQAGAIYDVEMQLSFFSGLIQRIVFPRIKLCMIHEKKRSATGNGY
jgi:predicted transposase/invertase (TIGR01784 family)